MKQQGRKNEVRAGTRFACCGKGKIIYMRNRLWKIKFAALCMVWGMMTLAGCNGEEREEVDLMSEMTETSEIAEADAGADTEGTPAERCNWSGNGGRFYYGNQHHGI